MMGALSAEKDAIGTISIAHAASRALGRIFLQRLIRAPLLSIEISAAVVLELDRASCSSEQREETIPLLPSWIGDGHCSGDTNKNASDHPVFRPGSRHFA